MKSSLEAVVTPSLKQVFGTVSVKRTVYAPTGNKWSGGFTWQITFTSRGWNVPMMVSRTANPTTNVKTLKSTHNPTVDFPSADIEDATHPLNPFANSRDGNQVMGTMMLKFKDVASSPLSSWSADLARNVGCPGTRRRAGVVYPDEPQDPKYSNHAVRCDSGERVYMDDYLLRPDNCRRRGLTADRIVDANRSECEDRCLRDYEGQPARRHLPAELQRGNYRADPVCR